MRGNDHGQRSLEAQGSLVKMTPRRNCAKGAVTKCNLDLEQATGAIKGKAIGKLSKIYFII